eukprot:jgi/Undpi1/12314/HiC_scaffold_5.g01990.m1
MPAQELSKWDARWSGAHSKAILRKFCDEEESIDGPPALSLGDDVAKVESVVSTSLGGKLCGWTAARRKGSGSGDKLAEDQEFRAVSKVGEFKNWAGSVQTAPAKVLRPTSIWRVKRILAKARGMSSTPSVRCMGASHSWSSLFADNGAWLLDTRGLNKIIWSATKNPTQVTIGPGVTTGQLATFCDSKERGEWRGMSLPSDANTETVTYGGLVNSACHGTGKTQTICDYVVKTGIITWDGTHVNFSREDNPEEFAQSIVHFGLLGVTVSFTFQLDAARTAVRVTDHKCRARDIFLGHGKLPGTGGSANPLLDLWNDNYAAEIFYFPASSLGISNVLSKQFEDQTWDEYNDVCSMKTFNRTDNAISKDDDSFFGVDQETSTRFDRNFSITDFLEINLGSELALPLVAKFGDKPALVSLYSKAAALAFDPVFKTTGEVSYEASLGQTIHWRRHITDGHPVSDTEVCIKCDPDFTSAYKAIQSTIAIVKTFAKDEGAMPLNVATEMRFTKHSDSPISPAYGEEGDVFLWIEVLSAVGTPRLKEFNTKVADAWLAIKMKDGSDAALPHWAKWSESYVEDADAKLQRAFSRRLPLLKRIATKWDPHGMFVNKFFAKLFVTKTLATDH